MRVSAFDAPISDLGGRLKVGACMMLEGDTTEPPGHVVCNVGHIRTDDWKDIEATVSASLHIMEELHATGSGFVSNVLCVVPNTSEFRAFGDFEWKSIREINLSVWSSQVSKIPDLELDILVLDGLDVDPDGRNGLD